jgi:hypothetical protein
LRKAIAEIDRRTRQLVDRIDREEDERREDTERLDQELAEFRDRVDRALEQLAMLSRRVATDGLRLQGLGLLLVGAGLVVQRL